jgi:hypothetical protein
MVVHLTAPDEILQLSRHALALPAGGTIHDEVFLAALVRRSAGFLCPCSPGTLVRRICESLEYFTADSTQLARELETAVERAMVAGDLLELSQVTTEDPNTKGTWVFAAPPAFVCRKNGAVLLMGIAPEEPSPLPASMASRIEYDRHYRLIRPHQDEDLKDVLSDLGLLELSEQSWLKLPRNEPAKKFRDRFERELAALPPSGEVPDLLILDSARDPMYYSGRWTQPKRETGCFVARRPQAYGAPLWGFARLNAGALERFLDFPLRRDKWRGSDTAWHLQLAIDACRDAPQRYRRRRTTQGMCVDFFSPLPLWAERRLAIVGRPTARERCLFSYLLPDGELEGEESFLQTQLWLVPLEG